MALTYTYVDLGNLIKEIADADLNFAGNWSSGSTYFFGDVTLYSDTRYLALASSIASQPPISMVRDNKWSALVLAVTGVSVGTLATDSLIRANEAYAIGRTALDTAWVGTSAAGSAQGQANAAYITGRTALYTSWVGTNIGHEAYDIGRAALDTSWVGTSAAAAAHSIANYATYQTGTLDSVVSLGYSGSHAFWAWTTGVAFDTGIFITDGIVTDTSPPLA